MLEDDGKFPTVRVDGHGRVVRKIEKQKPAPPPQDDVIEVVELPDFIARNGRPHKFVRATWKYPRELSMTELMVLSYFREHKILLDGNDKCVGFEGRKIDYDDYAMEHAKAQKKLRRKT